MSQVPMERYTVTVTPPGAAPIRLLIPFPPSSSISALAAEVKRRASRAGLSPDVSELVLHLGDAMGPLLDEEDLLEDVIVDSKTESITATPRNEPTSVGPAPPPDSNHVSEPLTISILR